MAELIVVTPAFDPNVCVQTYAAMVEMDMCGMDVECYTPVGYGVEQARTTAAKHAVETGAEWVLWVDSDVVPPKDALANLLSHGANVCFGYYTRGSAGSELTTLCEAGRSNYDSYLTRTELHEERDGGVDLVEVRGGGFGIVLVRTSVFRKIAEPWFQYTWSYGGRKLSEDYHFCTQCRNARIKLYADTRVDCGHVRQVVI